MKEVKHLYRMYVNRVNRGKQKGGKGRREAGEKRGQEGRQAGRRRK